MIYYCLLTDDIIAKIGLLKEFLPKDRLNKTNNIINTSKKCQSILSYTLLLYSVKQNNYKLLYSTDKHGKPYSTNNDFYFNMSHCNKAVTCIIGNRPNGIDVEQFINKDNYNKLINKVCNQRERSLLKDSKNPLIEITKILTYKESYLKYLGTGIVDDLKKIRYRNNNTFFESKVFNDFVITYCSETKESFIEVSINQIIDYLL